MVQPPSAEVLGDVDLSPYLTNKRTLVRNEKVRRQFWHGYEVPLHIKDQLGHQAYPTRLPLYSNTATLLHGNTRIRPIYTFDERSPSDTPRPLPPGVIDKDQHGLLSDMPGNGL